MDENRGDMNSTQPETGLPKLGIFSMANLVRYAILPVIILLLLVTAGSLIYLGFLAQQQQLEVAQQERSRAAATEINAYLDDLQRKLGYLARVRGLTDLSPDIQQDLLEGLTRHNTAYESVAIFNAEGQKVAEVSPFEYSMPDNISNSPAFLRTFIQKEDYVGEVEFDPSLNLPFVRLAFPIRDGQDEVAGVLLTRVNLEFLWLIVSQTDVGRTGYAYVLDNRNVLVAEKGASPESFNQRDLSAETFIQNLTSASVDTLTPYQGLRGEEVLGAIAPVPSVRWNVVTELPTDEAFAPLRNMLFVMGMALVTAIVFVVGLGIYFSRFIISPLQRLTKAATQMSAGNMAVQVDVNNRNEIGILAATFNQMATQLETLYSTLEHRVVDRTQRLELIAEITERVTAILNLDELLAEIVEQVKEKFGYYYVHIYLLNETGQHLVVAEGTGEAGAAMKAEGHRIAVDAQTSLVARAARNGEVIRIDNVREAEEWLPNPKLPDTYSEMAVPILLEGRVVGVLDVQHNKIAGLDEGDATVLRSLANQVAIAIRNARVFANANRTLAETQAIQERYVAQSWDKKMVTRRNQGRGWFSLHQAVSPPPEAIAQARQQAFEQNQPTRIMVKAKSAAPENGNPDKSLQPEHHAFVTPIKLQNQTIGNLQFHQIEPDREWSEDDLALIEAVVEQVALAAEAIRLVNTTQEQASRERLIGQVSDKFRRAPDLETLMKLGVEELSKALGVKRTFIHFGPETEAAKAHTDSGETEAAQSESGKQSVLNGK